MRSIYLITLFSFEISKYANSKQPGSMAVASRFHHGVQFSELLFLTCHDNVAVITKLPDSYLTDASGALVCMVHSCNLFKSGS